MEISDQVHARAQHYLPDNLVRLCIDEQGNEHQQQLTPGIIQKQMQFVDLDTSIKVVKSRETVIKDLLSKAETAALRQLPDKQQQATENAREQLQKEIDRLRALQTFNANVRSEEIDFFTQRLQRVEEQIAEARLRLDALRVLVAI